MTQQSEYKLLGIGAAIADRILKISDEELARLPGRKGGMECVDYDAMQTILGACQSQVAFVPGGSCSNVMRGLRRLGHSCALISKVGDDAVGKQLSEALKAINIQDLYTTAHMPTSQVLCLVTPDGQRTCRCYLGATSEMSGAHLEYAHFTGTTLVHIEGYTMLNESLTAKAMEYAKRAGALVSFDLASFEIVETYRPQLLELLKEYVDVVFANQEETRMLCDDTPEASCRYLQELCKVAVVSMNKNGCWVGTEGRLQHCPAYPVEAVDSTGAGDLFASGFLHGYLTGQSVQACAHYGALLGAAVVQVYGGDLPPEQWRKTRKLILEHQRILNTPIL